MEASHTQEEKDDYILTEQNIQCIFEESFRKFKDVITTSQPLYNRLVKEAKLSNEARLLLEETSQDIVQSKKDKKHEILDKELQQVGFRNTDPYFLACLKPLSPIVYEMFFRRRVTEDNLDTSYNIRAINQKIQEEHGDVGKEFKKNFYGQGHKYYKRLKAQGVLKKFPNRSVMKKEPNNPFIPMSFFKDYLTKMNKTAKDRGYNHLRGGK